MAIRINIFFFFPYFQIDTFERLLITGQPYGYRTFEWWICSEQKPCQKIHSINKTKRTHRLFCVYFCSIASLKLILFKRFVHQVHMLRAHKQSSMNRKIKHSMGSRFCSTAHSTAEHVCLCVGPLLSTLLRMFYEILLRIRLCIRSAWCPIKSTWCLKQNIKYHQKMTGCFIWHSIFHLESEVEMKFSVLHRFVKNVCLIFF